MYLYDNEIQAKSLDRKLYNIETYALNHILGIFYSFVKYLPLKTPWGYDEKDEATWDNGTKLSKILLGLLGIGFIAYACLSFFFEDRQKRGIYLQYLLLLHSLDMFLVHPPWIEPYHTDSF